MENLGAGLGCYNSSDIAIAEGYNLNEWIHISVIFKNNSWC